MYWKTVLCTLYIFVCLVQAENGDADSEDTVMHVMRTDDNQLKTSDAISSIPLLQFFSPAYRHYVCNRE